MNENFTEMHRIEGDPIPENYFITKFEKYDPTKVQGAKMLAIIKVWIMNEKQLTIDSTKEYHFIDPLIT